MKKALLVALTLLVAFSVFANAGKETTKEGGTLVIAVSSESETLLVHKVRSSMISMWPMFEGLFVFDETGNAVPFLVETYEEDIPGLTYTLHLHKGVKFHDGSELTAEVVKWNLDKYMVEGILKSFLESIKSVEVKDTYTVVLHLKEWDSLLPASLARQMGYMASKTAYETYGEDYCAEHPVGTGPFKFESREQGVQMNFTRFDDYWQGKPNLDAVEMVVYKEALVAQAALEAGDIDVWQTSNYVIADELKAEGFNVYKSSIPTALYNLYFECMNPDDPFFNVKVRKAASYAIDPQAISDALFNGYGVLTNQFATPGSAFYSNGVEGCPYDTTKAKALLKEAGYPNGFKTTMACWNSQPYVNVAQILKEQLAAVGIDVEIKLYDLAGFAVLMDGWKSGLFLHPMGISNGPAAQLATLFVKGLTSGAGANSLLHPDDVDALIQKAKSSDAKSSIKYFQDAATLIFEDYCELKSFIATPSVTAVAPSVVNCGVGVNSSFAASLWDTYKN